MTSNKAVQHEIRRQINKQTVLDRKSQKRKPRDFSPKPRQTRGLPICGQSFRRHKDSEGEDVWTVIHPIKGPKFEPEKIKAPSAKTLRRYVKYIEAGINEEEKTKRFIYVLFKLNISEQYKIVELAKACGAVDPQPLLMHCPTCLDFVKPKIVSENNFILAKCPYCNNELERSEIPNI
ncbi:MAG: hypothetical protein KGN01_05490 [Patescibacteria group bacterium]|nr:hypothetical protein [Patescibacteria group bacterium]